MCVCVCIHVCLGGCVQVHVEARHPKSLLLSLYLLRQRLWLNPEHTILASLASQLALGLPVCAI